MKILKLIILNICIFFSFSSFSQETREDLSQLVDSLERYNPEVRRISYLSINNDASDLHYESFRISYNKYSEGYVLQLFHSPEPTDLASMEISLEQLKNVALGDEYFDLFLEHKWVPENEEKKFRLRFYIKPKTNTNKIANQFERILEIKQSNNP